MTTSVVLDNRVADKIQHDMQRMPEELRKAIRPKLRAAGSAVVADAKVRSSWSGRIPATIRIKASFRFDREAIIVFAGGSRTPHARLYESVAGHAYFRHPVFKTARRNTWVSQQTRPFLFPAAAAHEAETNEAMLAALAEAAGAVGFGG